MQVGATGSNIAAQSAQAMNDILKMSVNATQDLSKKMINIAAQEKIGAAQNKIDLKA